jgi:hypothetical protein
VPALRDPAMPLVGPAWRDHLYEEITPDGLLPFQQKALYAPPWKVLWDVQRGTWELFDLAHDPHEIRNLFDDQPDTAQAMRARLLGWVEGAGTGRRVDDIINAARLPSEPAMQVPMHVRFGNVAELLGYDALTPSVPIGGVVRLNLYLRVLSRTDVPLWLSVNFQPEDGGDSGWPHFNAIHYPIGGRYPTTQWIPGEILRDEVSIHVEPEVRPTAMRERFSITHDNGEGVILPHAHGEANGEVSLGRVVITPPPPR